MSLNPGTKLGPYEILAPIGAGGMGEVYKAKDTRLDRTVAIKVLPSHLADNPDLKQRFEREARAVSSLNHPHICTLYDVGEQEGIDFLVMEYIVGETLADRLKKGALPLDQALQHGIEIADALDKAHRQGVVHRDLKPGNIILTKSGAKLLDFGLAKLKAADAVQEGSVLSVLPTEEKPLTEKGSILGTFQYMAPEQLEGKEADARTDIFAFGAVLYEMVTGRKAFEGKSQASLISAIMSGEPPALSSLEPLTPPLLERVVKRCLTKDPDDRWQSARDLHEELEWISESGRQPAVSPSRSRSWRQERVTWAIAVLTAIVAGFALGLWRTGPVPPEAPRPVHRFVVQLSPDKQVASSGVGRLALSPDGTRLAYTLAVIDGAPELYLRASDEFEAAPVPGTRGAATPFFSPDGEWVGFFASGRLKKVSVLGGAPLTICEVSFSGVDGADWGPDDTILFSQSSLWRVSARGGAPEALTRIEKGESYHVWPDILPGGKEALFSVLTLESEVPRIAVVSLETGERRNLLETGGIGPQYLPTGHIVYKQLGTLMASGFDLAALEPTGVATPLIEEIRISVFFDRKSFALSDTGVLAYMRGAAESNLVWVDRKGKAKALAKNQRDSPRNPRLSPDGKRLVFTSGNHVWVEDVERGTRVRLTVDEGQFNQEATWTPDGTRVTFTSTRDSSPLNLYWKAADGTGEAELLLPQEYWQYPSSWSPDARHLAFYERRPDTERDIWILDLEGDRSASPWLATAANEHSPRFSPNGHFLAYVSDESGREEVYVQAFPGPGATVPISIEGGREPLWSADGRELFFRHENRVMAVAVTTDSAFTVERPHQLFEGPYARGVGGGHWYDVTPDGQKFVMVRTEHNLASLQLRVVVNWLEELKRLVPTEN